MFCPKCGGEEITERTDKRNLVVAESHGVSDCYECQRYGQEIHEVYDYAVKSLICHDCKFWFYADTAGLL